MNISYNFSPQPSSIVIEGNKNLKLIDLYPNEKKRIAQACKGCRKAQKMLYETYAPKMLSICRQYVAPVETAEELMLNGFFKVFSKLNQFSHKGSFEGWIKRIMIRECIDHLRKKNPFRFTFELQEDAICDAPERDATESIPLDTIQKLIDSLPDGYRSVFVMYAIDEFKHQEIAQMLGIQESTSKTQYRKARLLLQERINQIKKQQHGA